MSKKQARILAAGSGLSAIAAAVFIATSNSVAESPTVEPTEVIHTAPSPPHSFRDVTCDTPSDMGEMPELDPMSWWAPSIDAGASFAPSATLPASATTNDGIIYSYSEEIGAAQGASLLVGHVDYEPGALSGDGGELTSWGKLHKLSQCDLIYTSDANGSVVASQLTSLYTAPQFDEELERKVEADPTNIELREKLEQQREVQTRIFRSSGPYAISFMTCSGPSVADVGGAFQFRYSDNLIAETSPVTEIRPKL